ncbi:LCP family protein [Salininema proteolyticum]|uniref:LCP family protein n=1 Tax=Salininema proteolyticum TaxID=1607685 RepID=A0ABV8U4Y1_9ACTN
MPGAAPTPRSPWWSKLLVWTGALVMLVAGGSAAMVQVSINKLNDAVQQEDILGDNRKDIDTANLEGPFNFLVLGVDEQGGGMRSDTMMIMHINKELTEASMISLPRDLRVEIADCGYGQPCLDKLNAASSISDDWEVNEANVIETINNLTGIEFHGAVKANFDGFLDLIDIVGEIELCPWHEITSIHGNNRYFPEGCNMYGKDEALDLVRQRKGWSWDEDWASGRGGDFGRQAMQQQAIMGILKAAKDQGFHKNPGKAVELLNSFGDKLTIDIGGADLTEFIVAIRGIDPEKMHKIQVPSEPQTIDNVSYVVMNPQKGQDLAADDLWQAVENDTLQDWSADNPDWAKA